MAGNTSDPGELNAYHEYLKAAAWRSDAGNYADPSVDYNPPPVRATPVRATPVPDPTMLKRQHSVTRMMPAGTNHMIAVKDSVRKLVFTAMSAMQGEHLVWENLCTQLDPSPPWQSLSNRVRMFEWVAEKQFTLLDLAGHLKMAGHTAAGAALETWLTQEPLDTFAAHWRGDYVPTFLAEEHVLDGKRY